MWKLARLPLVPGWVALALVAHAQDLPREAVQKPLEFEPQLMLTEPAAPEVAPSLDVAKLESALPRAQRKAKNDERLWRQGILAKVEAERSALKVVLLTRSLGEARLQAAQAALVAVESGTPEAKAAAQDLVRQAEAEARAGQEAYLQAQLDAAGLNLWRQQKLQAWGGASKAAVARAQEQLAQAKRLRTAGATLTAAPAK